MVNVFRFSGLWWWYFSCCCNSSVAFFEGPIIIFCVVVFSVNRLLRELYYWMPFTNRFLLLSLLVLYFVFLLALELSKPVTPKCLIWLSCSCLTEELRFLLSCETLPIPSILLGEIERHYNLCRCTMANFLEFYVLTEVGLMSLIVWLNLYSDGCFAVERSCKPLGLIVEVRC